MTILDEILANKRTEVERAKAARPLAALRDRPMFAAPRRNFFAAVSPDRGQLSVIAEVKAASPSAGVLRQVFDPVSIGRTYEAGGAQALSVLTDETYFRGRLEHLEQVRGAVGLPILRKDFVFDAYQLVESRAFGADAVLLIVEALDRSRLADLLNEALSVSLAVLVEVYERASLETVAPLLADHRDRPVLLGINNRNLKTQRIDLGNTERLAPLAPPSVPVVAESGVRTREDAERMRAAGARALLIGETLMRSGDPAKTISELTG